MLKLSSMFLSVILIFCICAADSIACQEMRKIENALLTENWQQIITLCNDKESLTGSSVLRLIKGIAYLPLNRNNESLEMFLSIKNEADRNSWKDWTSNFAKEHPANAVALFLKGDALSRTRDWNKAVTIYSEALKKSEGNSFRAMVLNARGVAFASLQNHNNALNDLERAIELAPGFADAYASLGTILVMEEASDGALNAFEKALRYSKTKNWPLALLGRSCARYGQRDFENVTKAVSDFVSLKSSPTVGKLALINLQNIIKAAQGSISDGTNFTSEGMSLKTRDMLFMDSTIRGDALSKMSNAELVRAYDQTLKNAKHSERWFGIFDILKGEVKGVGIDLTGKSKSSLIDAQGWRHANAQIYGALKSRGFDPLQGGATTVDLQNAYSDRGKWPVKTWFGLAQYIDPKELP